MSDFDNGWSVASVFNTNGTCHSAGIHSHSPAPTVDLPCAPVAFDNPRKNTESVADCIRKLGYTVQCGRGGEGGRSKYIIISISKKKFYYGSQYGTCYQYLSGKRSVYEGFLRWKLSWRAAAAACATDKELEHAEEKKMFKLIDEGSSCSKNCENWETGASTIGNTLPNDIVQALQDFRSVCPGFVREPNYEFYIPPSMQETPDACPPPEPANNLGGGAQAPAQATVVAAPAQATAVAAPAQATAVAAPASKKVPTSESSDTSDSEDD
jgi:hypothetical protein